MKQLIAGALLAVAMLVPSTARAADPVSYDFCGGSFTGYPGLAFCASVTVGVTQVAADRWTVKVDIANLSGMNGTFAGSLFANIGLDNLVADLATPTNLRVWQNGSVVCGFPASDPASGSVSPKPASARPATRSGRNRCFCSSLP